MSYAGNATRRVVGMKRVLLVEDEALIRWSIRERLQAEGFEIVEAADGATALEHISRDFGTGGRSAPPGYERR